MNWQEKKALQEEKKQLADKYFTLLEKSNICKMLDKLCLFSDNYTVSCIRLEKYQEQEKQDNKILEELNEELLFDEIDFYHAFFDFLKLLNQEDIKNASK